MSCSTKPNADPNDHLRCIVTGLLVAAVVVLLIALLTTDAKGQTAPHNGSAHALMLICHQQHGCKQLVAIETDTSVEACQARLENVVVMTRKQFPEGVITAEGICLSEEREVVFKKTWELQPDRSL